MKKKKNEFEEDKIEKNIKTKNEINKINKEKSKKNLKPKIIKNLNLKIKSGDFIAVLGKVGSGKTSLLYALIDEMVRVSGSVKKNGKIALIPQEAFLLNDTIQANIIFGEPLNHERYQLVLNLCELDDDLNSLPAGDKTEIGERGVNISGGQKQRISIARAVYSEADIFLIDDALSALDAYVGSRILKKVFEEELKEKTRVMVTHNMSHLKNIRKIIFLDKGEIVSKGNLQKVQKNKIFKEFAIQVEKEMEKESEEEIGFSFDKNSFNGSFSSMKEISIKEIKTSIQNSDSEKNNCIEKKNLEKSFQKNQLEEIPNLKALSPTQNELKFSSTLAPTTQELPSAAGHLMQAEKRFEGVIGIKIFLYYFSKGGITLSITVFLLFALTVAGIYFSSYWLGAWAENRFELPSSQYPIYYSFIVATLVLTIIIRTLFYTWLTTSAGFNIFSSIIWNILRRPMSFFDTTSSGVILNRCIGDIDELDSRFPLVFSSLIRVSFLMMGTIIIMILVSPLLILVVLLLSLILWRQSHRYVKTSTELRRLVQLSLSPVLSRAKELTEGVSVIRGFKKSKFMLKNYISAADLHHNADLHEQMSGIWMRNRIHYILAVLAGCYAIAVALNKFLKINFTQDTAALGLVLIYISAFGDQASRLLWGFANTVKSGNSIQRLHEYEKWEEHEAEWAEPKAPLNWPMRGDIELKNLSVRYREGLPLVLDKVNFCVRSGEKIGVVGRTGSGKSTLLLALMRILELEEDEKDEINFVEKINKRDFEKEIENDKNNLGEDSNLSVPSEPKICLDHIRKEEKELFVSLDKNGRNEEEKENLIEKGKILIDNIDISKIGLHHLRSKLSIIPQDPFLFQGTLKENMDPFNYYSESLILEQLKHVGLLETINNEDFISQISKFSSDLKSDQNSAGIPHICISTQETDILKLKITDKMKLSFMIESKGANLSIGQKQLLCIARALIRKPKILLMDEATANIDEKTDSKIQKIIKYGLKDITVVTIAHRLSTIIQYDNLLILADGKKVEEGSPSCLLEKESYFKNLVEEGGEVYLSSMKKLAGDHGLDPAGFCN